MESTNAEDIVSEPDGSGALPAKQELALRALISNPTHKEAAFAAGISETTLWRYMRDQEFSRRLREARCHAMDHAVIRLQRALSDAVMVLHNLMNKEDAPAAARVTAARTVLDYTFRLDAMEELERQIEELTDFIRMKQEADEPEH